MYHFVANLKPYTIGPDAKAARFDSYLLSVDYTSGLIALTDQVHKQHSVLVADNGNFDRMGALIAPLMAQAATLAKARQAEEKKLGHLARPGELSSSLQKKYAALRAKVVKAAAQERKSDDVKGVVKAQNAMAPTYLIGMEDFSISLMVGLGIERAYAPIPMSFFTQAADRAIAYAVKTTKSKYGPCDGDVFAGLHAIDYDTAVTIGGLAGKARVDGIATGFGATLDDRDYCDYRIENGKIVELGSSVPRSYVRVMEVAAGLHVGYVHATGHRPKFHALGVGTPILQPMLAVLGDKNTYTCSDSTAPIKDAYSSVTIALYVDTPAPLKLKAYVIAQKWLDGGIPWDCKCPYCTGFLKQHPFQLTKAKAWWASKGKRKLTPKDMWAPSPLAELMPLLSMPKNTGLRKQAGMARIGHNHWVLKRLETNIRRRSGAGLRDWVDGLVEKYVEAGSGVAWKGATKAAWAVALKAARQLKGAGGEFRVK
jgi:hypothetical protein